MKNILLLLAIVVLFANCDKKTSSENTKSALLGSDEIQTGGVKMVEIETLAGKFKVWTKKFGDNPRVKILLLHGGQQ